MHVRLSQDGWLRGPHTRACLRVVFPFFVQARGRSLNVCDPWMHMFVVFAFSCSRISIQCSWCRECVVCSMDNKKQKSPEELSTPIISAASSLPMSGVPGVGVSAPSSGEHGCCDSPIVNTMATTQHTLLESNGLSYHNFLYQNWYKSYKTLMARLTRQTGKAHGRHTAAKMSCSPWNQHTHEKTQ